MEIHSEANETNKRAEHAGETKKNIQRRKSGNSQI